MTGYIIVFFVVNRPYTYDTKTHDNSLSGSYRIQYYSISIILYRCLGNRKVKRFLFFALLEILSRKQFDCSFYYIKQKYFSGNTKYFVPWILIRFLEGHEHY